MDKYYNMHNISTAKVQIKMFGALSLKLILVTLGAFVISMQIATALRLGIVPTILFTISNIIFAIYLITRNSGFNPKESRLKLLVYGLTLDCKHYYPLERLKQYDATLEAIRKGGFKS